ncbi:CCA tRNA nucleotidyltransferase [Candidatus Nanohalococcus occultus]|uniref:CCA tRNA nucleotidyltransferase n=1 Tax=Candidatus Nanohalococcus occultus TaxID=2978047 RepID=UPI0039E00977
MNWKRLRTKVLEQYGPTDEEISELRKHYEKVSEIIESTYGLETHFAGSASRETCMTGDNDIDVFVLFPSKTSEEELKEKGLEIGKTVFEELNGEYHTEYAEHPYTKGEINGLEVEIVPCFDVEATDIRSSVDRTPHHSRWVQNNLDEKQREDVVILKAFLTCAGLYGSSLKVEGFSGYSCEILIAEFGSFQELMEEAKDWNGDTVIDPENHHEKLPESLENKFSGDSLKIIDPVDPERNVTSVLSTENYAKFIYSCWRMSEEPGMDFFTVEETEVTEFEISQELEKHGDFLVMEFDAVDEVEDIVYPQMRKTMRALNAEFRRHDFQVYDSGFFVGEDRIKIFFEVEMNLPEIKHVEGPKVYHNFKHMSQFQSKYENTFIKGERIYGKSQREFSDAKRLLKAKMEKARKLGVPERIADELNEFRFTEPTDGSDEWLKYLAEKLYITGDQ